MVNLAENSIACDCGKGPLAPAMVRPGELAICATCGLCFRVVLALESVSQNEVDEYCVNRLLDGAVLDGVRARVQAAKLSRAPSRRLLSGPQLMLALVIAGLALFGAISMGLLQLARGLR